MFRCTVVDSIDDNRGLVEIGEWVVYALDEANTIGIEVATCWVERVAKWFGPEVGDGLVFEEFLCCG